MSRKKILTWCAKISYNHPVKVLSIFILLAILSGVASFFYMEIITDQDKLMSEEVPAMKDFLEFRKNFGDLEFMYVVVEVENNKKKAKKFVDLLSERIRALPDIKMAISKVDIDFYTRNFLLFIDKKELIQAKSTLKEIHQEIQQMDGVKGLNQVFNYYNKKMLGDNLHQISSIDYLGLYFFLLELDHFLENERKVSKLRKALFKKSESLRDEGYLFSDNKKFLFILVLPQKDYTTLSVIEEPLNQIRQTIDSVKKEIPGVKAGLTGQPVLQADEMITTDKDMTIAAIIAIIGVTMVFILALRNIIRPILAMVSLIIAIALTFGVVSIYPGHLNLLSMVFTITMIGLGIDYGIHLIARYHEELANHVPVKQAIENTLQTAGLGNITGTLTSAMAFYISMLIDFKGVSELGFIAGTGLIITLVSMILFLPALLTLLDRNKPYEKLHATSLIQFHFLTTILPYSRWIIIGGAVVTLITIVPIPNLSFNNNLLELQADGLESVEYEKKITSQSSDSAWFTTYLIVNDMVDSDNTVHQLRNLKTAGKIESLRDYIPSDQAEKIKVIASLEKELKKIKVPNSLQKINYPELKKDIQEIHQKIKANPLAKKGNTILPFVNPAQEIPRVLISLENHFQKKDKEVIEKINLLQEKLIEELHQVLIYLNKGFNPEIINKKNLPEVIKSRFLGKNGQQLVHVVPEKSNIWLDEDMEEFVLELRSLGKKVVGPVVSIYETTRIMKDGLKKGALYVFLLIIVLLYIDFHSIKDTILAMIPVVVGLIWLFGIMSFFNLQLNMANFFSIPILLGTAIDYGVHIIHRYRESNSATLITQSTGSAIILTAITTVIGFGSMMTASHRGLVTLGEVMVIGSLTTFLASIILLPAILKFISKGEKKEQ